MLIKHTSKGSTATKSLLAVVSVVTVLSHTVSADTVYRCGESYSTSSQCANGTVSEVRPSSALHTPSQDKDNGSTLTRDLRDAQTLEKQRLLVERKAAQAAPLRFSTPSAPTSSPSPSSLSPNEPLNRQGKRKGKLARQPSSPYFTAVDPSGPPKKKSTAKAVPTDAATSP